MAERSFKCPIQALRVMNGLPLTPECEVCNGELENVGDKCLGPIENGKIPLSKAPFVRVNLQVHYTRIENDRSVFYSETSFKANQVAHENLLGILAKIDLRNSLFRKLHEVEVEEKKV